jgi:C-methyltransferase
MAEHAKEQGHRIEGPADIIHLLTAHQATSVLVAGIELRVFDALVDGPRPAEAVAAHISGPVRTVRMLLDGLCAIGALEKRAGQYQLTPTTRTYLVTGVPEYLGGAASIFCEPSVWTALRRLDEAVLAGGAIRTDPCEEPRHPFWETFARNSVTLAVPAAQTLGEIFSRTMATDSPLRILDVGCGSGALAYALAQRFTQARVTSLDWPNVLAHARGWAHYFNVEERVEFVAGDFFEVAFRGPYDVVLLSHIYHHFGMQANLALTRKIAAALAGGGQLVVQEFVVDEEARETTPHLFSLLMLTWTREGQAYSLGQLTALLSEAGFAAPVVYANQGLPTKFLIAKKR